MIFFFHQRVFFPKAFFFFVEGVVFFIRRVFLQKGLVFSNWFEFFFFPAGF